MDGAVKGTLLTWGLTALGAAPVLLIPTSTTQTALRRERVVLDGAQGFASGVMVAASVWSLLLPALSFASDSGAIYAISAVSLGFLAGGAFLYLCEVLIDTVSGGRALSFLAPAPGKGKSKKKSQEWRRVLLLVLAVTAHNFPEGMAVGVAFAGDSRPRAWAVALGIGLQNLPEGAAVALPMYRAGSSRRWAFFIGQLSGLVEPVGGVLGYLVASSAAAVMPLALSFAAGAMIYVVANDLIVEGHSHGNGRVCTLGLMLGFVVMMSMDVLLG